MNQTAKIYILRDPLTNDIRYCGQTVSKIEYRLKRHVKSSNEKVGRLTKKEAWIKSLGSVLPKVELIEECEKANANEKEIFHINRLKLEGHDLTNLTEGGNYSRIMCGSNNPNFGKKLSQETKNKISDKNKGEKNGMFGKKIIYSDKRRAVLSRALLLSEALKNRGQTWKQSISNAQSNPINIISVNTGIIKFVFKNAKIAAEQLGCTRANITNAARDNRPIGKRIKMLGELCWVKWA